MASSHGGNNGHSGITEQSDQADGNYNVAEDGSKDDITLDGPTITDVFSMQPLQNGEWFGVHEGSRRNGDTFAGLEPRSTTHPNEGLHNGVSTDDIAPVNFETPYVPLNNWLRSANVPVTDLLYLLALREERGRARRRTSERKSKPKPQQRK